MTTMESIVRPFVIIESDPFNRIAPIVEEPLADAEIVWGDGSRFIIPPSAYETPQDLIGDWEFPIEDVEEFPEGTRFTVVALPSDEFDQQGRRLLIETARLTSQLRVENPDDPEQFVIIERIDKLLMADNEGRETILEFRNP